MPFKVLATAQETLLADLENGVSLIGTFNDFDETSNPMQKERDNVWSIELDSVYSDTTDNAFAIATKSKNYKWNGDTTTNFGTYALELNGSDNLVFGATLASKKIKVILDLTKYDYATDTGAVIEILDLTLYEVDNNSDLIDFINNNPKNNIKLTSDVTVSEELLINNRLYLDLNGYVLKNESSSNDSKSNFVVYTTGDLTILDSRPETTHKFDTTELITKFNDLQSQITALNNVKSNYVGADEALKKELGDEITAAQNTLQMTIDKLTADLNATKTKL